MNIHPKKDDKKNSLVREIFFIYTFVFFLWTAYRMFFSLPEWIDECIAKPIVWVGPLIYFQKSSIKTLSESFGKNGAHYGIFGLCVGVAYFAVYTILSRLSLGLPTVNPNRLTGIEIIIQAGIALCTGCTEEILFRKFILEKSLLLFHDSVVANSFAAFLFTLIHLPIILFVYHYPLIPTLSYLSLLFLTGFIYGLVYLKNRSLTAATITHAAWNFLGTVIR